MEMLERIVLSFVALLLIPEICTAQKLDQPTSLFQTQQQEKNPKQDGIQIQGQDNLAALIDFYRKTKKLQILVQPQELKNATQFKIQIDPNHKFPESAVDDLLLQLLRLNNQALVPVAGKEGWLQIVPLEKLRPYAQLLLEPKDKPSGPYATKVFQLNYISTKDFRERIEPFLARLKPTGRGNTVNSRDQNSVQGNIIYLDRWGTVLITDLVSNLERTKRLIDRLDTPRKSVTFQQIPIHNQPVQRLAEQLRELLSQKEQGQGNSSNQNEVSNRPLVVKEDVRGSRILLRGSRGQVLEATKLIDELDQVTDSTETYILQNIGAKEFVTILNNRFGNAKDSSLRIETRADDKTLVISAPISTHKQIVQLKNSFDRPIDFSQKRSPLQTYVIKNRQAREILNTIEGIGGGGQTLTETPTAVSRGFTTRGINSVTTNQFGGPGGFREPEQTRQLNQLVDRAIVDSADQLLAKETALVQQKVDENTTQSILQRAHITLDDANNTIIVEADPEVQALLKDLIDQLDRRRPQVLVEVTVVSITSLEDTALGLEVSVGDRTGTNRSFTFTQFGLSTADAASGVLSLSPGVGFNGAILKPDVADVILRSLAQHERAKVITAPRVLVRDNATGVLTSVAEVPYAGLNSGQNFSSTTLQGFAEAGTTISVSPQISEANHLNLKFDVLINDFTGNAADNLPPPRQTNQVVSEVAIPDGHTVIVGGLTRERFSKVQRGIPFLEKIPILRLLGGNVSDNESTDRLFVFIRPVILRDNQFRDLIRYSNPTVRMAPANDGFPESKPRIMYPRN